MTPRYSPACGPDQRNVRVHRGLSLNTIYNDSSVTSECEMRTCLREDNQRAQPRSFRI